jgi:vacuolar iron transporter family protein
VLPPDHWRVPVTVISVLIALILTGLLGARLGRAAPGRAILRNVIGGALAMGITYFVGSVVGRVD